jgi:hypothetical protein
VAVIAAADSDEILTLRNQIGIRRRRCGGGQGSGGGCRSRWRLLLACRERQQGQARKKRNGAGISWRRFLLCSRPDTASRR